MRRISWIVLGALCALVTGCGDDQTQGDLFQPAGFQTRVGVETVTVLGAEPDAPLTLYSPAGEALVTLKADDLGQAHFAYVPPEHVLLDPKNFEGLSLATGNVLQAGAGYTIRDDTTTPPTSTEPFTVKAIDEVASADFYASQSMRGVHYSPLSGAEGDLEEGFQFIEMRDGVLLSAMVRFPDSLIYGEGPYPTVIEYSGYSPSRPEELGAGILIANALGYATVGVNMRGTGCSGGVFDLFNRAQQADGYDIVEIVASQPWVMNQQVGMVGLSYPGISQLYAASTNPPSLAAIVPLSTIADAWEMQWPGGIYNKGFTKQWVAARESQAAAGGTSWVNERIDAGDEVCTANMSLSNHNLDFETLLLGLEMRPPSAADRDLNELVEIIEAPVFYGGSFQDEQTGAQFGGMLDRFQSTKMLRVVLTNGRHIDGFALGTLYRWFEFLEFYVAERIPELNPLVRDFGVAEFASVLGMEEASFEEDRFTDYESYDEALAAYEAEPVVRVLFESGAGTEQPGSPVHRFEQDYDTWPTDEAQPISWFMGPDGQLLDESPEESGADVWRHDATAGDETFFGPKGYELFAPLWDNDWSRFAEGDHVSYVTPPFEESMVVAGPGYATLWVKSPEDDVMVQVTLTEVRPDGMETLVQSGWLRLGHRASEEGPHQRLQRTYASDDFSEVPVDTWVEARVTIPSVAHPVRAGSALRLIVSSPGRDHGTWEFLTPDYEGTPSFELGYGGERASSLSMARLPGIDIPEPHPPCPSLRGQPCRAYEPTPNQGAP